MRPLTGSAFAEPQVKGMRRHWFKAMCIDLPQPGYKRGVDNGAQRCIRKVIFVGALHVGKFFAYGAPVIDIDVCPGAVGVPPLYGFIQLTNDVALFCGKVACMHGLLGG